MAYTAEISRANPGCICFILDQSGSMSDQIAGGQRRKAEFLADAVNRILENLSVRCAKGEEIRDYFDIIAVGYGPTVSSAFGGTQLGRMWCLSASWQTPLHESNGEPRRSKTARGGLVDQQVRFPSGLTQ